MRFTCNGARLAGTLYLPLAAGAHPAVVWVHGSGEQPRLSYGPLVASFVAGRDRILLLRQARRRRVRGQLLSGRARPLQSRHGRRCRSSRSPACVAIRRPCAGGIRRRERGGVDSAAGGGGVRRRRVRRDREPRGAAAQNRGAIRARDRWSRGHLAASLGSRDRVLAADRLRPTPSLEHLDAPALWLFGGGDRNVPPVQSVALLHSLKRKYGKDWTIVAFPGAGHGLFDDPPTDPRAVPTAEAWVRRHVVVRPERTQPATS